MDGVASPSGGNDAEKMMMVLAATNCPWDIEALEYQSLGISKPKDIKVLGYRSLA